MTSETKQPDMDAMMAEYAKYSTPGPEHETFERLVGKWTVKLTMWFEPGAPPNESGGDAEFKLIHGGRYLLQTYNGNWMGQPFDGMGLTGFDRFRKEYNHVWIDSAGTMMMVSKGTSDNDGKVIKYSATIDDPVRGRKDVPTRMVDTAVDGDTQKVEMFCPSADGTEYKNMEIIYTRKK